MAKIETVSVTQGVTDRIFDCGKILLTGTGSANKPIAGIAAPVDFRDYLTMAIAEDDLAPADTKFSRDDVKNEAKVVLVVNAILWLMVTTFFFFAYSGKNAPSSSPAPTPLSSTTSLDATSTAQNLDPGISGGEPSAADEAQGSGKADLEAAGITQDYLNQSTALVAKVLQAERDLNASASDQSRSELATLPKPQAGDGTTAEPLNKAGVKALNAKNYSEAIRLFTAAIKANAATAKYFSNLGFAQMYEKDLEAAENNTCISLAIDPSRLVAWENLGQIYAQRGKQDDAVTCFLVGYRLNKEASVVYLKSLNADEDPAIREAGVAALNQITGSPAAPTTGAPLPGPGQSPTPATSSDGFSGGDGNASGAPTKQVGSEGAGSPNIGSARADFGPYMADLQKRIKRAWFPPRGAESKRVKVAFKVGKEGQMTNLRVLNSSELEIADAAALKAVENAAPFRPLPDGTPSDVDIEFTFDSKIFNGGGHGVYRPF